jgi:hypothetical protein
MENLLRRDGLNTTDPLVTDVCAVGAAVITDVKQASLDVYPRMTTRYRPVGKDDVVLWPPTNR